MGRTAPVLLDGSPSAVRQEVYASAAEQYGVPVDILLAVSYLETRWDTHAGKQSRGAGHGPKHLTDVVAANQQSAVNHYDDEDARGDSARPLRQAPDAKPARTAAPPPTPSSNQANSSSDPTNQPDGSGGERRIF